MIAPGSTIGILGGGQLGRMLALAAAKLGLRTCFYAPEADSPAFDISPDRVVAAYEDEAALARFAQAVDLVTYEFENVPAETARYLHGLKPLRPGLTALVTTQDRLREKTFVSGLGIATAPFRAVSSLADLEAALAMLGYPAILKTRCFGYDGKGQVMLRSMSEAEAAYEAIGRLPAIVEGFVPFAKEISIVAARGSDRAFAAYAPCENTHRDHILDVTVAPASISPAQAARALSIAERIAQALDYIGVLAVEMFVVGEDVVVNEIAPRVHNSGHWTIEGAKTSQFEQHIRAICGWPLGSPDHCGAIRMRNLIGAEAETWPQIAAESHAHLHLYGKTGIRAGRKMGHVTYVEGVR